MTTDEVRVHEIAKELGINSKEVVESALKLGLDITTASSRVDMKTAEKIMNFIMNGSPQNQLPGSNNDKVRIHEIAKELGINSKSVVETALRLGLDIKTASSSVDIGTAEKIMYFIMNGSPQNNIPSVTDQKALSDKSINIEIRDLKSISTLTWNFTLAKGIHVIIGENGVGKSSFIVSLAKLVKPSIFQDEFVGKGYESSTISYKIGDKVFEWQKQPNWALKKDINTPKNMPTLKGLIESSILSGSRFNKIDYYTKNIEIHEGEDDILEASDFIKVNMNYIMHGNNNGKFDSLHYVNVRRRTKGTNTNKIKIRKYHFYAIKKNNIYINEFFFSTGEYFLLSLLKYLYDLRNNNTDKTPALVIIDEIELSLHPLAQKRLVEKIHEFVEELNLSIVFATHSLQIIEGINPNSIYYLANEKGNCSFFNPIYPGYITSKLYEHTYFDRVILVEDSLAVLFIHTIIESLNIKNLSHKILPIGGWEKVLEMFQVHNTSQIYGRAQVIAILDGDVASKITKKHHSIRKHFLPIKNVESYIVNLLHDDDTVFIDFLERIIQPKKYKNLNLTISVDGTDQIKKTFKKLLSEVEIYNPIYEKKYTEQKLVEFILKRNSDSETFVKFRDHIQEFMSSE